MTAAELLVSLDREKAQAIRDREQAIADADKRIADIVGRMDAASTDE